MVEKLLRREAIEGRAIDGEDARIGAGPVRAISSPSQRKSSMIARTYSSRAARRIEILDPQQESPARCRLLRSERRKTRGPNEG